MTDLSKLQVASSPHIRIEDNTRQIMLDVIIALMPALAISVFVFGPRSLVLTLTSALGCVFFEWFYQLILRKPITIGDLSAVVTGILLAFCMPVSSPLWLVLVGDAFAIVIVKQLYGGIGRNFMNPALGARAFLMASFPALMTAFTKIQTSLPLFTNVDAITAATPLDALTGATMALPDVPVTEMALGMIGGCMGETSSLALLAGALYLLYRRVITWHIPVSFIGTVALLTLLFPHGNDPVKFMSYHVLAGGLLLGAFFMATDYSSSPVTRRGQLLYGLGCGALTVFIRFFGSYPEGVSYAILIMNACVYLIEKATAPRKFGYVKPQKPAKGGHGK